MYIQFNSNDDLVQGDIIENVILSYIDNINILKYVAPDGTEIDHPLSSPLPESFKITDDSLERLKNQEVPNKVLEKLKNLKEQEIIGNEEVLNILLETIGETDTNKFKTRILKESPLPYAVLSSLIKTTVMIITQTCDLLRKPFITVACIYKLVDIDLQYERKKTPENKANHILNQYQKVSVQPGAFYLQESSNFPKSVVSFMEIHTFPRTPPNIECLKQNRVLRLNPEALEDLQFRIGYFFGRFASPDNYMLTSDEKSLLLRQCKNKPAHPTTIPNQHESKESAISDQTIPTKTPTEDKHNSNSLKPDAPPEEAFPKLEVSNASD